jgi:hypothetical protein
MDILNRFSVQDFLAYLFPGVVGALGVFVLLLATPLAATFAAIPADIFTGIILFIWSYCFGLILSGLAAPLVRAIYRLRWFDNPRESLPFPDLKPEFIAAFRVVFNLGAADDFEWQEQHFILCRSLIEETMPNATQRVNFQNGIRRFREKMAPVTLIWWLAGIIWGISSLLNGEAGWGSLLVIAATLLALLILSSLADGIYSNHRREVRDVASAFLAGRAAGKFGKPDDRRAKGE